MTSTEPLRTIQTYSTGPAPWEKITWPRGVVSVSVPAAIRASSSAPSTSKGGCAPRKAAMSSTGPGSGGLVGDRDHRRPGLVLGQHRRRAAAQPGQVVDDADAAEQASEGERAPLEVPVVGAVDRGPRPGQVDHDAN